MSENWRNSVVKSAKDVVYIVLDDGQQKNNEMVESATGEEVEQAKKEAYLSDKNRRVDEEVVAKNSGEDSAVARATTPPSKTHKPVVATPELKNLGIGLLSKKTETSENRNNDNPTWVDPGAVGYHAVPKGSYVRGLKEGEATALNTKEFVFFGYFQRIRKQLDLSWKPILHGALTKRYRRGRTIASEMNYVTRTLVTLNTTGHVIAVRVLEESGTLELDDAAVKAFNDAGPFPNPPTDLVDQEGEVKVRWDFILRT